MDIYEKEGLNKNWKGLIWKRGLCNVISSVFVEQNYDSWFLFMSYLDLGFVIEKLWGMK